MEDYIVRATAAEGTIRAVAAITTEMVNEARNIHGLSPVASAALGRTMTAAALMSMSLKNPKDVLTLQVKGDGPLGGIVVVTDTFANVRGYVYNPEVSIPLNEYGKLDVGSAVGREGYLNVIKDLGLKEPYVGYVKLVTGEIGDDLAYYYASSEQVPSVVSLGVLVNSDESIANAGGFIIQLMPGAGDDIIDFLEAKINEIPPVTKLLSEGKSPEDILQLILGEKEMRFIDSMGCRYLCNCSRERMERAIISLGREEIKNIIEEQHGAELHCHFCNEKHHFSEEDLKKILETC
ncbi:MAG: Hsp33 family molecular chaperone HslO [Clostridia bacterium]|nr:Hsp33 family molecular chaperone HslO [Clostridia bacterium]